MMMNGNVIKKGISIVIQLYAVMWMYEDVIL